MKKEYGQFLIQEFSEQLNSRFPDFVRVPEMDEGGTYFVYKWSHREKSCSYLELYFLPHENEFYFFLAYSNKGRFPEDVLATYDQDDVELVDGEFRIDLQTLIGPDCAGWKIGRRYRGREKTPYPKQEGRPAGWMKKVEEENIKFAVTDAVNMIEKHAIPLFNELAKNYP